MNDLRKELLGEPERFTPPLLNINKKYLLIFSTIIVFGWYVGILLFGTNSIVRLNELQSELNFLHDRVEVVKNENAKLQKELFEIKQIRGEH